MPRIFPTPAAYNIVIQVNAKHRGEGFIALMTDAVPDIHANGDALCFPLYIYDDQECDDGLFASPAHAEQRRLAITDAALQHFQAQYPSESIGKKDLFFYSYGILHSRDYLHRYADNLSKELPRIPRVKTASDFWAFSKAGRDLTDLHVNYESVAMYPLKVETRGSLTDADYRVEKMKFAKKKSPATGKNVDDRTTVIYNSKITLRGIPEAAWDYEVNGKAALDWVMERQSVRTDKASSIINDANDWAVETMGNPRYPLELFQRVVTVSLETQRIVNSLPPLDI